MTPNLPAIRSRIHALQVCVDRAESDGYSVPRDRRELRALRNYLAAVERQHEFNTCNLTRDYVAACTPQTR